MKKRRLPGKKVLSTVGRVVAFLFQSQIITLLLGLCVLGFVVGKQTRPDTKAIPFEELFESLSVVSYRDAPSDTIPRFVVELAARGKVFQEYDVDARRFTPPPRGQAYRRAISGTRYTPLKVRGHVDRGFWLEIPDSSSRAILPDQYDELYRTTLDFVKPVSVFTDALGLLSGYSIGYRMATWNTSLANPAVQARVLAVPGLGRVVAREAWRCVLLEPVVMGHESDAERFASARGTQRVYTNFFRLALSDSNGFIPHEAARLDSSGCAREARAMRSFARAVARAVQDTCDLMSPDFAAIEGWASLLDRHGHWAHAATPPRGEDRMRYVGTLAWYGIAPAASNERRIWVGPRVLIRHGETEGFVADEIPSTGVGCPIAWREWVRGDPTYLSANAWTARWMSDTRQFAPIMEFGRGVSRAVGGGP